jgi:hypothetical protein
MPQGESYVYNKLKRQLKKIKMENSGAGEPTTQNNINKRKNTMTTKQKKKIQTSLKYAKQEMRAIETEQDVTDWSFIDPEDMSGMDAFSRGFYRSLEHHVKFCEELLGNDK